MQWARLPGTVISWPHKSGTSSQSSCRAANAGNSASRSGVVVKIALAISFLSMPFRWSISARSCRVAVRISSRLLWSTVVAPRTPRHCILTSLADSRSACRDQKIFSSPALRHGCEFGGIFKLCERFRLSTTNGSISVFWLLAIVFAELCGRCWVG